MAISKTMKDRRGKPIIEGLWYWVINGSGDTLGAGKFAFDAGEPARFFINGTGYDIGTGTYELADQPQPPDVPTTYDLWMHAIESLAKAFPNPLQIGFGEGRIGVHNFSDKDGTHGIMFTDTGEPHEVGADMPNAGLPGLHTPEKGEVYLRFKNAESLDVVVEALQKAREKIQAGTTAGRVEAWLNSENA